METLYDKTCNKLSMFVTAVEFLENRDKDMLIFFYPQLSNDFWGLIALSKEKETPEMYEKVTEIFLLVEEIKNLKFNKKNIEEMAKKIPSFKKIIDEIKRLSQQ